MESFDSQGRLTNISFHYPDNFNFGFDMVHAIAARTPGKRAMVWCNAMGKEHTFTFADISRASNRIANVMWDAGIRRGGVYHTGDATYRDENGKFYFHGRNDDLIKTGGFRVGPSEVENVLMEHDAVLECAVVGIPDHLRGQAIKAYVILNPGYSPDKDTE